MRQLKTLLLVATIAFSSVVSASTDLDDKRKESATIITEEIGKLLQNPSFIVDEEFVANVTITLNKNNEMVVLSVDAEDVYVQNYIKGRLNYKVVPALKTGQKTFKVPIRVTPGE